MTVDDSKALTKGARVLLPLFVVFERWKLDV